jgi:flagellar motor protein MotB
MAPRIVDEREHRRGLILGLTLAEVLLLLLFLLMLALAVPLKKRIEEARSAEKEVVTLRSQIEELKWVAKELADGQTEKLDQLATRLQNLRNIESLMAAAKLGEPQLRRLLALVAPFSGASEMETLEVFLQEAASVNPDDPPASLKRASAFVRVAGKDIRPELVSALAPITTNEENLRRLESIYEEAARVNPDDPPAALVKALKEMERLAQAPSHSATDVTAGPGEHNWPPIISLSEADGYYFPKGKAELSSKFERKVREKIVPSLLELAAKFRCDVIEVTGHTDEQAIASRNSNLDQELLPVLRGTGQISTLIPSDNAGLGLARSVAVARMLLSDPRLKAYRVLPMSAGQLIDVGERVTLGVGGDVKQRRRIEIRLRRSSAHGGEARAAAGPRASAQ